MALLILPSGEARTITPARGEAFTLEELQTLVGGFIELTLTLDGQPMIVNEDGIALGLPLNVEASRMARAGRIVGPALVCARPQPMLTSHIGGPPIKIW